MARHWTQYTASGVTYKQARMLDRMAAQHGYSDGLDFVAAMLGKSRSKTGKEMGNKAAANQMIDAALERANEE